MHLGGQGGQRGYAMAALLVSIGVMMLLMSVAMPVWRHEAQREKEAELVFRGEQYARAINLFQRKMGPGSFPPNIDILVQQRFLRKKYKDPITDSEFQLIPVAGGIPQVPGLPPQQGGGRGRGPSSGLSQPPQQRSGMQPPQTLQPPRPFGSQGPGSGGAQFGEGGQRGGGIMGVVSKSKDTSIRVYHGATHYNEWTFLFSNVSNRPGAPAGAGVPGIPGGQRGIGGRGNPGNPGGPGNPVMNPGGLGQPGGSRPSPGGPGSGRGFGGR